MCIDQCSLSRESSCCDKLQYVVTLATVVNNDIQVFQKSRAPAVFILLESELECDFPAPAGALK